MSKPLDFSSGLPVVILNLVKSAGESSLRHGTKYVIMIEANRRLEHLRGGLSMTQMPEVPLYTGI